MKDLITDILDTVRFKSTVYFKHGFCGNWGMDIPKGEYAQFHFVSGGRCVLQTKDEVLELSTGDLIIFPKGHAHQIKATTSSACIPGQSVVSTILNGHDPFPDSNKVSSHLICGHYELDRTVSHFIFSELPDYILIRSNDYGRFDLINSILNHIIDEISQEKVGFKTVVNRMAEVLFLSILRHYYTHTPKAQLNIFNDLKIYKSINYIHNNLNAILNIEILSRQSGISRTLFIQRFKKSVGNTPLSYIKTWRMTKARQLLVHSKLSLGEIADEVGYSSVSSFNRVFKSIYSNSPSKYRKSNATG